MKDEQLYLNAECGEHCQCWFRDNSVPPTVPGAPVPVVTYRNVSLLVNEVFDVPNSLFPLGFYQNQLGAFLGAGGFPQGI